jgi:hypothetical protein
MPESVLTIWSFNLTARQLLLLLIGCGLGGNVWQQVTVLSQYGLPGEVLRFCLALLPFLLALFIAFYRSAGRSLEVWLVVLLRYWLQPKKYVWRSIRAYEEQLYPVYPEKDVFAISGSSMRRAERVRKEAR